MKTTLRWLALVAAGILLPLAGSAQQPYASRIDPIFAEWDRPDSPGASVAVIRRGAIVFSKGYGAAQLEYEIPITPATVFHVASVSKQFTAMAVTMLAADGKLSLDDEVQKHLVYVPTFDRTTTVRQLIHHTSGIRDQWELLAMAGWRLDDVITMDHIRSMIRSQRELNFEPNSEYLYSNMGYTLLAEIAATLSGQSFPEFTKSRIFDPLGMYRTHFHDDHKMIVPNRAYSYSTKDDGSYEKAVLSYANAGATSLFTTAEDLVRWLDNFRHARVGGREVVDQMQQRATLNNGEQIAYAHGVSIGAYRGVKTVSHSGGDAGFRSHVAWFAKPETGIAVLSNLGSVNPSRLVMQVADAVIADEFPEPLATDADDASGQRASGRRATVTVDPRLFEDYVGKYQVNMGFVLDVTRDGGRLMGTVPGQARFQLLPTSETEFFLRVPEGTVTFHRGATGRADSISLTIGDQQTGGNRLEVAVLTPGQIASYTGVYYSEELGTFYEMAANGDALVARHRRHGEIQLSYQGEDDFTGDRWFFQQVKFERDGRQVTGLRVTGGRVRNLWFAKR